MYARVAPFTGAWIEILSDFYMHQIIGVAPFTGAWIEIARRTRRRSMGARRSLYGSVD